MAVPSSLAGTKPVTAVRDLPVGLWLFLLCVLTALLSVWAMAGQGFNGLFGQDPYAYYGYGVGPLRHFLLDGKSLTPMYWPLGFPTLVALSSILFGSDPPAGQVVSLLCALSTVPLTYLFGSEALRQAGASDTEWRRAALLGAALVAVAGGTIQSGIEIMPDSLALATSLLSGWALLRWCRDDRASSAWLVVAAAALAYSIISRWGQAVLALVWLLAVLPALARQPRRVWPAIPIAVIVGGLVLGFQLWLSLTVSQTPGTSGLPFAGNFSNQTGQWSMAHLFERTFINGDGVQSFSLPNVVYYGSILFRLRYLTPLLFPAALLGAVLVVRRFRTAVPMLIVWPSLLLLLDAGLTWQNPRFPLPALPPVAVLSGLGIAWTWERIQPRLRPAFAVPILITFMLVTGAGFRDTDKAVAQRNDEVAVVHWTEALVPPHATLLSFGITSALQFQTPLRPYELFQMPVTRVQMLMKTHRPVYVLVQVGQMVGPLAGKSPGLDYRFLRRRPGLLVIGQFKGYSLFRVQQA